MIPIEGGGGPRERRRNRPDLVAAVLNFLEGFIAKALHCAFSGVFIFV